MTDYERLLFCFFLSKGTTNIHAKMHANAIVVIQFIWAGFWISGTGWDISGPDWNAGMSQHQQL